MPNVKYNNFIVFDGVKDQIWGIMHLTYHDLDPIPGTASAANAGEAGAPGPEIEITDEMIAAGVTAAAGYDSRFEPFESLPIQVYEAMERVRRHRWQRR